MKTRSLARQTIAIVIVAQVLSALFLGASALWYLRATRLRALDIALQGRSDSLLGAIQDAEDPEDNVTIDPAELDLPNEDIYAVYNQGGRLLGGSADAPAALIRRNRDGFGYVRSNGQKYRVLQREAMRIIDRAEFGGIGLRRPVTLVYATPATHVWHEVLIAARFYFAVIVVASLLSVLFVAALLQRALRPLSALATAAAGVEIPALAFSAPAAAIQVVELRPLVQALDTTINRLREAFAKEQRFVGDAAHELKTAVAVVRSSIQVLMLRVRSTEEYGAGLERILEDNRRVESLITQMLQVASAEEMQQIVAPAMPLHDVVIACLENLGSVALQRSVALEFDDSAHAEVRLQPEQLNALVTNILHNAIQHSDTQDTVRVTLTRAGDRAVLRVIDSGEGIPSEALPHVFERFYRVDRSRSRATGGTGLGLAICKAIVSSAGGSIELESEPGRGTTVTVIFRVA